MLPTGDAAFVQIVDAALADAARRSGDWLACRPGCNQCCTGVFAISALDAERLREGMRLLAEADPDRHARVRRRVTESVAKLAPDFPGDPRTGALFHDEASQERFEDFANDETCPVLDPATGTCDLYAFRPMTCRTFGPPVRTDDGGFGICELCFVGADEATVAAAEMRLPSPEMEASLIAQCASVDETIVAFALHASTEAMDQPHR